MRQLHGVRLLYLMPQPADALLLLLLLLLVLSHTTVEKTLVHEPNRI